MKYLNKQSFSEDVCHFITEVKKMDGSNFPGGTMYDIMICLQFWLESEGYNWRLVSDEEFVNVKFTLDNIMKDRAARGVGGKV